MTNTVIIIPSRLQATRLPEKPLKIIKGKEMVLHVLDLATKSSVGDVLVATPDTKISDLINKNKGKSFLSQKNHQTGTDRVFEAYEKYFQWRIDSGAFEEIGPYMVGDPVLRFLDLRASYT